MRFGRVRRSVPVLGFLLAGLPLVGSPAVAGGATAAAKAPALPFIEDDYAGALAEARRTGKPLFVDAWAPWCHTCLSLRSFVFTDARVAPFAKRFVWLALDTEKESNAAFLKAHPIDTWPTLLVIDPRPGQPPRTWRGALTAPELVAWLAAATTTTTTTTAPDDPYRQARDIDARVGDLRRKRDNPTCVAEARAALPKLIPGTSQLDVALEGLTCAGRLPAGDAQKAALAFFSGELSRIVSDREFPVLADDRSSGFEALVQAAEEAKDAARAKQLAGQWAGFLEEQAARAPDARARAVFDPHRVEAYLALGQPERAIPMLKSSAKAFPRDYNPPARLARAYLAAGRLPEARIEIDRALRLVYGPRRKRLEALERDIAAAEAKPTEGSGSR
jgi:thiol-disulfide isomerase/thioredoxin